MQELIEAFKQEMLKQLQEDLKRSEKWEIENKIFENILASLLMSSPYDIVYENYTQEQIFHGLKKSIFFNVKEYNFRVYLFFEDVGMINSSPEHAALWRHGVRHLAMNIYDIDDSFKPSDDLNSTKAKCYKKLSKNKKFVILLHHEIAHKMFGERLKDIGKLQDPNGLRNNSEYNSVLSELYHYMVQQLNLDTNNIIVVEKFLNDLSHSNDQYDWHLWNRLSKIDRNKLIKHIQRFRKG